MTASMATFLKIVARLSAIGTFILAGVILGSQVTSWILTDEWNSFPISRALTLAHFERPAIYVTASVSDSPPPSLDLQTIYDWFLDLPAGGFLLVVAAVLLGFSVVGASLEKQFAPTDK
jgi:DMSO/TMAO reductase YedYZ molybdopterin-dependent catalytic subunit